MVSPYNEEISNSYEEYLNISTTLTVINITSASSSDEGGYTCLAWNDFGKNNSALILITVQALEKKQNSGTIEVTIIYIVTVPLTISLLCIIMILTVRIIKRNKQRRIRGNQNCTECDASTVDMDSIPTVGNAVYGMHVYPNKLPSSSNNDDGAVPIYEEVKQPSAASHPPHMYSSSNDSQNHYDYARYTFATTIQQEPASSKKKIQKESDSIYMNMPARPKEPCAYENVNF